MQKTGFIVLFALFMATAASAQIPSGNVFFGYSYYSTDLTSSSNRVNTNGWEASVEGKIIPWVGIVADFDSHYGSQNIPTVCQFGGVCAVNAGFVERNFLFGPRVSVKLGKVRPFAEALFGGAHASINDGGGSDTSFADAIGGGLDYKIIPLVAWRVQGDYVQTRLFGLTQNNARISTGIVLRF
jgi:hypothetical protein